MRVRWVALTVRACVRVVVVRFPSFSSSLWGHHDRTIRKKKFFGLTQPFIIFGGHRYSGQREREREREKKERERETVARS